MIHLAARNGSLSFISQLHSHTSTAAAFKRLTESKSSFWHYHTFPSFQFPIIYTFQQLWLLQFLCALCSVEQKPFDILLLYDTSRESLILLFDLEKVTPPRSAFCPTKNRSDDTISQLNILCPPFLYSISVSRSSIFSWNGMHPLLLQLGWWRCREIGSLKQYVLDLFSSSQQHAFALQSHTHDTEPTHNMLLPTGM